MRVLWFTNVPFPDAGPAFGGDPTGSGGWLWGLADALDRHADVSLGIATACRGGSDLRVERNGVVHYRIAVPEARFARVTRRAPDRDFVRRCLAVAESFQPDLIHVHGTEQTYGLLTAEGHLPHPAVVSLQGILRGILPHYFGTLSFRELCRCHGLLNLAFRQGILFERLRLRRRCDVEARILAGTRHVIGHTLWDRALLREANPGAVYHGYHEALRPTFYLDPEPIPKWDRPTLVATYGGSPLRGTDVLLRALVLVRAAVPGVELRLARGEFRRSRRFRDYSTHLDRFILENGLSDAVTLLPPLDAGQYALEMRRAHAFVLPSLMENGSNTLLEAMILGTPSVASYVGGATSYVDDGETALCFPAGDHAMLAEQLIRLLRDEALAGRIAARARETTRRRHDPERIAARVMEIYRTVLQDSAGSESPEPREQSSRIPPEGAGRLAPDNRHDPHTGS